MSKVIQAPQLAYCAIHVMLFLRGGRKSKEESGGGVYKKADGQRFAL